MRPLHLVCVTLVLLGGIAVVLAEETPSFGCEDVWPNASAKNDVVKCLTDTKKISKQAGMFVPPAICVIFLVFLPLCFPFFFCCRQCCNLCGGHHRQPGYCCTSKPAEWMNRTPEEKDAAYGLCAHLCAKLGLLITYGICAACIIVMCTGAGNGIAAVYGAIDDLDTKVIGTVSDLSTKIKTILVDPSPASTTGYVANLSRTTFDPIDSAVSGLRNTTKGFRSEMGKYVSQIQLGASLFSAAPLIFLIPLAIFVLCNIRHCGPACCTCCYFFLALLFCLVGIILFIIAILFTDLCGEVDRYHANQPGILKWYAEPMCDEQLLKINISSINSTFTNMMTDLSGKFCRELTNLCDLNPAFDGAKPTVLFQCSITLANANSTCRTFTQAKAVIAAATAKTGINACGGGTSACNMTTCVTSCDDASVKTTLSTSLNLLNMAEKFQSAFETVTPVMSCGYWFNVVLHLFDRCHLLRDSLWQMGCSATVCLFTLVAGIVISFRGQKVFSKRNNNKVAAEIEAGGFHQDTEGIAKEAKCCADDCGNGKDSELPG